MLDLNDSGGRGESWIRRHASEIVVGIMTSLAASILWAPLGAWWQHRQDEASAVPSLVFQSAQSDGDHANILLKSESSRIFIIHKVWYRFREIKWVFHDPQAWMPDAPKQVQLFDRQVGAPIAPDVIIATPQDVIADGKWLIAPAPPLQVDAYQPELISLKIKNRPDAGTRVILEVAVAYGDLKNPSWVYIPQFETNIAGLLTAIDEELWQTLIPKTFAGRMSWLIQVAGNYDRSRHQKTVRGPKKKPPKKTKYRNGHHLSVKKILDARNANSTY